MTGFLDAKGRFARSTTCALVWLALTAGAAMAQEPPAEPPVSPGQSFYDQGSQLYGDRQYADALVLLVQAIQADPSEPRYWIGAARAANFSEELDLAVRLYDDYITHFAEHAEAARRRADRLAGIQRERDQVNSRRPNPETAPALPAQQAAARAAFVERLATGPAVAQDGSGALNLYYTLLRTGLVSYELITFRQQLASDILTQLDRLFQPAPTTPLPVLDLDGWEAVPNWYESVERLGQPVLQEPLIQARLATAEGQRQLLNGNFRVAIEQFDRAVALDPSLVVSRIGLLIARHRRVQWEGCCIDPAGTAAHLDVIEAGLPPDASYRDGVLNLIRATVAADSGDFEGSASYLITLFTDREAPETPASW